jgi:hypothetical protein
MRNSCFLYSTAKLIKVHRSALSSAAEIETLAPIQSKGLQSGIVAIANLDFNHKKIAQGFQ